MEIKFCSMIQTFDFSEQMDKSLFHFVRKPILKNSMHNICGFEDIL